MYTLSEKTAEALAVALRAHQGQHRRGSGRPYVVHPIQVGLLLVAHGFDEVVVIAGILHDVLEDSDESIDELRETFGLRVVNLLEEVSEPRFDLPKEQTWERRKEAKLRHLEGASQEALAIVAADHLQNALSLLAQVRAKGLGTWQGFRRGPEQSLRFKQAVLTILERRFPHPLTDAYRETLSQIIQIVEPLLELKGHLT